MTPRLRQLTPVRNIEDTSLQALKPNLNPNANLIESIQPVLWMNDNRVQTNSPGLRLIPETATFLDLCIVACRGWIFIRSAAKVKGGATKELDETILRILDTGKTSLFPVGLNGFPTPLTI